MKDQPSQNPTAGASTPAVIQAPLPTRVGSGSRPLPAGLTSPPDAFALLKALRRRLGLALGLGIVLAVVGGVTAFLVIPRPSYTATATLRVARTLPSILKPIQEEGRDDFKIYLKTQEAWITSRPILKSVIKAPKVAQLPVIREQFDPIEWLEERLEVKHPEDSELLQISLSDPDPAVPVEIINAMTKVYREEVLDKEREAVLQRLETLKTIQSRYQKSLEERRKALALLSERAGSGDKDTLVLLQQFSVTRLASAESELAEVQSELRRAEIELEVQQKAAGANPAEGGQLQVPDQLVEQQLDRHPDVAALATRIKQARSATERTSRLMREGRIDPSLTMAQNEFRSAQNAMLALRQELRPAIREQLLRQLQPARAEAPSTIAMLEEKVAMLRKLAELVERDVVKYRGHEREFKQTSVAILAIQDEIANMDAAAKQVGTKIEALTIELAAPARVSLIQGAERPHLKDEMRRFKLASGAAAGMFAAALAGISFWEFRTRKISTPEEVTTQLGLRIIGALPAHPSGRSRSRRERWQDILVESVNATRTTLLHASRAESIRVLMVTSAVGGEGKTTLASHLATSLARTGLRTLLLDGDLRNPSIHRLFDLEPGPGLGELLRGEIEVHNAIRATAASNLWIMPAGRCDAEALEQLARDRLRLVLDALKVGHDFIVIDAPPVLPVADSPLIGQHADAVVLSVLREVSRLPKVYAAHERLATLGIRMLGAIVIGVDGELYGNERYYTVPNIPVTQN